MTAGASTGGAENSMRMRITRDRFAILKTTGRDEGQPDHSPFREFDKAVKRFPFTLVRQLEGERGGWPLGRCDGEGGGGGGTLRSWRARPRAPGAPVGPAVGMSERATAATKREPHTPAATIDHSHRAGPAHDCSAPGGGGEGWGWGQRCGMSKVQAVRDRSVAWSGEALVLALHENSSKLPERSWLAAGRGPAPPVPGRCGGEGTPSRAPQAMAARPQLIAPKVRWCPYAVRRGPVWAIPSQPFPPTQSDRLGGGEGC